MKAFVTTALIAGAVAMAAAQTTTRPGAGAQSPSPAAPSDVLAVVGGKVFPVSGPAIENGTIQRASGANLDDDFLVVAVERHVNGHGDLARRFNGSQRRLRHRDGFAGYRHLLGE